MLNTNRAKAETPWIYPWEDRPICNWKENAPAYRKFYAKLTKILRCSNLEFISVDQMELVKIVLEYIHAKRYPQGLIG